MSSWLIWSESVSEKETKQFQLKMTYGVRQLHIEQNITLSNPSEIKLSIKKLLIFKKVNQLVFGMVLGM